ncbi:Chs5p-Arf1p-binding proteins-domain-containing protein [Gorgonomyces haynaldii]|nr:Chs5p-Arf1p-binding proteins-domain-containing protein [Gorgonomyces haynaldii]
MVVQPDPLVLRGIAEFFENDINEAIAARTEALSTFRELGPPDLCHVVKSNPKASPNQVGSYHYVLGPDTSSSATIAAYLNSLTYMLGSQTIKNNPWKITGGTFCCYNAFSRVDMRVSVKIPGGVEAYCIDIRGERQPISNNDLWREAYVSSVLRALLDNNDEPMENDQKPLLGLRKMDPMPTLSSEKRFLDACAQEFWKGWQLGSDATNQVPTFATNHMTQAIVKYFRDAGRLREAIKFLQPLFEQDADIGAVLAKVMIECDEEIQAVNVMFNASKKSPVSQELLITQSQFLASKKQHEKALRLAKMAVANAPSEYSVWENLSKLYIDVGDIESALLALNQCPMYTFHERDQHRMPSPARTHLPLRQDPSTLKPDQDLKTLPQTSGTVVDENDPKEDQVHPELQRLPSLSLRGTFYAAYQVLITMMTKVGWDELLKHRSRAFVMEDEYRIHRAIVEEAEKTGNEDEEVEALNEPMETVNLDEEDERPKPKSKLAIDDIMAKAAPTIESNSKKHTPNPRLAQHRISFSFKHKRLCEKWLDNLFMVLYNDLRLYTALNQEMSQFKNAAGNQTSFVYRKTGAEWEVFGDLALRMKHPVEAQEAYKLCLSQKMSPNAHLRLLHLYANDGNIQGCLQQVVKMVNLSDRSFMEHTYPSSIARGLFKIIGKHGLVKVQNALISMNVPQHTYRHITQYFEYAELFSVDGHDW